MFDTLEAHFFVIWDRYEKKFMSIVFSPEESGFSSWGITVSEKKTAKEADDLAERLTRELGK